MPYVAQLLPRPDAAEDVFVLLRPRLREDVVRDLRPAIDKIADGVADGPRRREFGRGQVEQRRTARRIGNAELAVAGRERGESAPATRT